MAAVLITGRDGRTALLAFTGHGRVRAWNPRGPPGPGHVRRGGAVGRAGRRRALLVDVAGPVLFVVEGEDLADLAAGTRLAAGRRGACGLDEASVPARRGLDVT